ncbi:amidase [Curvivirga sp.]|uniref:amidase n=1 Tax=Curvivirga sp. TaxID=2856848 RepID=UPI003B5AC225
MSELCFRSAVELRQMIQSGELGVSELLEAFISQIEKVNPIYNGLVTLNFEEARHKAKQLDNQSDKSGLLFGLPLAVKDVFETKGLRSTKGSPFFKDYIPSKDDLLVRREREAGALIVGKSNTPDCASGGITINEIFGLSKNPWNIDKTCSGSGGGGVVALASGCVALADGSDIGGSVRSPASWTNLVGFRPSSGWIPGPVGSLADGDTSTAGIFARTVQDAALFMQAVAGPDVNSAISYPNGEFFDHQNLANLPKGLTISWMTDFAGWDLNPEMANLFEDHAKVFEEAGLLVSRDTMSLGVVYRKLYKDFNAYGYVKGLPSLVLDAALKDRSVKPSIQANVDAYMLMSAKEIYEMFNARDHLRVQIQNFMQKHDVIISPVHNCLAYGALDYEGEGQCDWSALYLAPLLGLPSIVLPCGFTSDGMPHGIMITGRKGEDQLVMKIAYAFEKATGYGKRLPKLG